MEERIETIIWRCDSSSSIDSRTNDESDMKGIDIFLNIEKLKESSESRRNFFRMTIHHFESFFDDNSIFIDEWYNIGHSSNGNYRQKIIKNLIFFLERIF
jgi:inorganic pyrophosphatase